MKILRANIVLFLVEIYFVTLCAFLISNAPPGCNVSKFGFAYCTLWMHLHKKFPNRPGKNCVSPFCWYSYCWFPPSLLYLHCDTKLISPPMLCWRIFCQCACVCVCVCVAWGQGHPWYAALHAMNVSFEFSSLIMFSRTSGNKSSNFSYPTNPPHCHKSKQLLSINNGKRKKAHICGHN